jgi:hypothetical protein
MLKAYISRWKEREKPEQHKIDYWFTSQPENAASWATREEAENNCVIFDHHQIVIPSAEGGPHVCSGFKVEGRAPGEFVVYCVAPFVLLASGEATTVSQSQTPRPRSSSE